MLLKFHIITVGRGRFHYLRQPFCWTWSYTWNPMACTECGTANITSYHYSGQVETMQNWLIKGLIRYFSCAILVLSSTHSLSSLQPLGSLAFGRNTSNIFKKYVVIFISVVQHFILDLLPVMLCIEKSS